jgi:hypothetical protein
MKNFSNKKKRLVVILVMHVHGFEGKKNVKHPQPDYTTGKWKEIL